MDPARHEQMARRGLSKFRVDYSQNPGSPSFEELTRLENIGHYPHLGGISFTVSSYVPEGRPMLRLVVYAPHDGQTAEKVAEWRRRASGAQPSGITRDRTAH